MVSGTNANDAAKYMKVRNLKSDQLTPLSKELKKVSDPNAIVAAFKKHIDPVDLTKNQITITGEAILHAISMKYACTIE